jgi:hypothetical protein
MDMAFGVCDFRREGVQLRFTLRREERGERREERGERAFSFASL